MRSRLCDRFALVAGTMLAATATLMAAGPTIDGRDIPTEFAGAPTVVHQRFQTQFDDCNGSFFCNGSELDKMFVMNDADNLYIGLTGNLENNGNCIVIFLDVDGSAGGANPLKTRTLLAPQAIDFLPRYLTGNPGGTGPFGLGLHNLPFDSGFFPDFCLGLSGGSPRGSQSRTYYLVNWTTLAPDANNPANLANDVAGMITTGDEFAAGPVAGTLGSFLQTSSLGILAAADNGNAGGMQGGTIAIDCPNSPTLPDDPNSVTLGFEFAVPLSLLGVTEGQQVCIMAMVSSPDGFMSNQVLPPPEFPLCNFPNLGPVPGFGGGPPVDFNNLPGNQFICHTITAGGNPCGAGCNVAGGDADVNDDCAVNIVDLGVVLSNFGSAGASHAMGDTNGDGNVDITDLGNVLALFGTSCP